MSVDDHYLQSLLAPRSIALVGASERRGSAGEMMVRQLSQVGFPGEVYPVNPRYREVLGQRCYASLSELPAEVDLAVLNLAGHRIEAALNQALDVGTKAFVIFDPCMPEGDTSPTLGERLRAIARETGAAICGGNGMGYSNFDARCFVGMWVHPDHPPGSVTLISHSGSVFMISHGDLPCYFNLAVSAGQELGTSMDEYIDYALAMPTTRCIALFAETVRNPDGFHAALARAREQRIPVVVCKVGRSEAGARQAFSHTGAISGDNDAFDALLEHHWALKVDTVDELFSTATLLASPRKPPTDGFALFADSGGLCGSAADRAVTFGVDFSPITEKTREGLKAQMPLATPDNPFDGFMLVTPDFLERYRAAHDVMLSDPNIGLYAVNVGNDDRYDLDYMHARTALDAFAVTDKAMVIVGYTGFSQKKLMEACYAAEMPLIIAMDNALVAARCFLEYHRRHDEAHAVLADADTEVATRWQAVLSKTPVLDEHQSLALFADFGVPVIESRRVECAEDLVGAAQAVTFPVALKTAAEGVHHKSDVDGVLLDLDDESALHAAYESLSTRLGARALVSAMAEPGVEMALGMFRDVTAGPVVVVGPGGTLVEYFDERAYAIPPFDAGTARRLLARLRFSRTLEGVRGRPAADLDSLAQALASFSVLCAALSDHIAEIDINPLIAGPGGVVAVDGLVVSASSAGR